jgi:DNA-binding NtrC family response regulator
MTRIIVVDDEPLFLRLIANILGKNGYEVSTATGGEKALEILAERRQDIVVTDYLMSPMDGMQLLRIVNSKYANLPVIMISGYGTMDNKAQALRDGAFDYLNKPVGVNDLLACIQRALDDISARSNQAAPVTIAAPPAIAATLVGNSPAMQDMNRIIEQVASSEAGLLLVGEPGTGKKLIAGAIHRRSQRKQAALAHVPCRSLTLAHLYHALFGHDKEDDSGGGFFLGGALAEGGSILLEEVGALPQDIQAGLLLALQTQQFQQKVGGPVFAVNTRLLATSSVPLESTAFNKELLKWIGTVTVRVTPLRDRRDDIEPLCDHFREYYANRIGRRTIAKDTLQLLQKYAWPSNVLELKRALKSAFARATDGTVKPEHLPREVTGERRAAAFQSEAPDMMADDSPTDPGGADRARRFVFDSLIRKPNDMDN